MRGLPYVQYCIAYFQCEFRLCSRKALGRVLKSEIPFVLPAVFLAELCTADSYFLYILPTLAEDLLALSQRGGVIQVNYGVLAALEGFKRLFDKADRNMYKVKRSGKNSYNF